ncbi:MAG: hypothetical protein ABEJ08_05555 [Halobacteriaceae archaeon]
MRIAVDVDDVLADRVGAVLPLIRDRYGVEVDRTDVDEWDYVVPGTETVIDEVIHEAAADPDHLRGLAPVDGARAAMATLADGHALLVATDRDAALYGDTRAWLDDRDIPYDRLVPDPGPAKTAVGADVLVDDRPSTVRRFARERGRAILFEQPWNADSAAATDPDVTVAPDWPAVVDVIQQSETSD